MQGKFQILSLSGSYLVSEDGGPTNRTGGISVSLSSRDGHVIGGSVAMLIAGSPIQVFILDCTKIYTRISILVIFLFACLFMLSIYCQYQNKMSKQLQGLKKRVVGSDANI